MCTHKRFRFQKKLNFAMAKEGKPIFVIGHGLFSPRQRLYPSVSKGMVSKIVYFDGHPLIIETDARVNRGASGGLLLDAENGNFLGLVTSNTKTRRNSEDGLELEKLNCSIPPNLLEPVLMFVQGRRDALEAYLEPYPEKEKLWSLQLQHDLPNKKEKQKSQSESQFFTFVNKFTDETGPDGGFLQSKL